MTTTIIGCLVGFAMLYPLQKKLDKALDDGKVYRKIFISINWISILFGKATKYISQSIESKLRYPYNSVN